MVTDYLPCSEHYYCYDIGQKTFVPQQFVEMLLQNKPRLVRYKKQELRMPFSPSVECGKFTLKKSFSKRQDYELCSTFTFMLIKAMLKSLFHMHALLELNCAILTYILHFFALCCRPKSGGMAQYSHPKYVPGCACLNGHSILVTAWSQVFSKGVDTVFYKKVYLW